MPRGVNAPLRWVPPPANRNPVDCHVIVLASFLGLWKVRCRITRADAQGDDESPIPDGLRVRHELSARICRVIAVGSVRSIRIARVVHGRLDARWSRIASEKHERYDDHVAGVRTCCGRTSGGHLDARPRAMARGDVKDLTALRADALVAQPTQVMHTVRA